MMEQRKKRKADAKAKELGREAAAKLKRLAYRKAIGENVDEAEITQLLAGNGLHRKTFDAWVNANRTANTPAFRKLEARIKGSPFRVAYVGK